MSSYKHYRHTHCCCIFFIWHTRVISYQRMYSSPSHALRLYSARAGTPLVPSTAGGSILPYSINIRCCITSDCPLYQAHGKYKRETIGLIPGKLEWIWLEYRVEVCMCQCNWLLCISPCTQQELDGKMLWRMCHCAVQSVAASILFSVVLCVLEATCLEAVRILLHLKVR